MTIRFAATFLAVLLTAGSSLAQECPDLLTDDSGARRLAAKKWFTKGEDSTKIGDDLYALKAFQCSLKYVPHGFTAFNIAQIAERVGDLELAIASYNKYLLLVPEAKDADEINRKVLALKERLARVKQEAARASRPATPRPAPVEPPAVSTPPVDEQARPADTVEAKADTGPNYRLYAWISYGGAAAFILGGVITNVLSREKMETCRTKYNGGDRVGADSECSAARPLAYTSYVMFGVAGAAIAAGTTFLVLRASESTEVAMTPLPEGGFALRWGGTF
jgi:hypothetical protein